MKKLIKKMTFGFLTLSLLGTSLFAAKDMTIASGGENGNYYTVAQDMVDTCGQVVKEKTGYELKNISTGGSVDNLNGLLRKKYSIGFVQSDVYYYFKSKDQMGLIDLKTEKLMNLYPEYLHILIPVGWKPQTHESWFSKLKNMFSGNSNKVISINSLKNQTVYAKGGALISAQALSYFMHLNLHIVDANKAKVNGPFIFVTGSGDPRIQAMLKSGKWWLMNFDGKELSSSAPQIYKPATVSYLINGKIIRVNTVSIMAKVYARKYRSKKRQQALIIFKQCLKDNINDLIDDGNSPKWTTIGISNGWIEPDEN